MTTMSTPETRKMRGYLTWWTIAERNHNEYDLRFAAASAGVPDWMVKRINGRNDKSAWIAATQLGSRGRPSIKLTLDPEHSQARYLTCEIGPSARALVREVTDLSGERVTADTVANIYFNGPVLSYQMTHVVRAEPTLESEVRGILEGMRSEMTDLVSKVDDSRIRSLIKAWLDKNYQVCVRGTGGVYFIPAPSDQRERERLEGELIAIRDWVNSPQMGSSFATAEIWDGKATTLDTYVKSAIEEVTAELNDIDGRLSNWSNNPKMNDGSKAFSSEKMVERLGTIEDKIRVLEESLGEQISVMHVMLKSVSSRAQSMQSTSSGIVASRKSTARDPQTTHVVAELTNSTELSTEDSTEPVTLELPKKSGTTRSRNSKVKVA